MSKRKLQKYCQLTQALKAYDSEFYQALDDLCLLPLLRPGPTGITFLYPEDKSVRKSIIDATYSKTPEKAVKLVKALILRGCYRSVDSLSGTITNALNHLVEIKGDKWEGFSLTQPKDIEYFDHRGNISIIVMKGKGTIKTTGELSPIKHDPRAKEPVTGGSMWGCGCMCWPSHRVALAKKLAKHYKLERQKKSNVFVKKVTLQLCIIKTDYPDIYRSEKLYNHLGCEELSDSFLLDMITPEEVFCKLWQVFGKDSNSLGDMTEDQKGKSMTYYERYKHEKMEAIKNSRYATKEAALSAIKSNKQEQEHLISKIVAVCDIREALISVYRNKYHLGKDLFIVFTCIMKEMWEHEQDMSSFDDYSYMAINVYTCCDDMVNQEFNQFKDATLHGNLLKSDVFKFIPWPDTGIYKEAGYPSDKYPKPIDLSIFSLISIVDSYVASKTGGAQSIVDKYLA
jgi:hypothetical protein